MIQKESFMWEIVEAIEVIRELQPLLRPLDFHLALGGGVLNAGYSDNDLDICCLPVFKNRPYLYAAVEQIFYDKFGAHSDLCKTSQGLTGREGPTYKYQWRFQNNGRVVDVFVGNPEAK